MGQQSRASQPGPIPLPPARELGSLGAAPAQGVRHLYRDRTGGTSATDQHVLQVMSGRAAIGPMTNIPPHN